MFLIDVGLTLELNVRFNFNDLLKFFLEIEVIQSFINPGYLFVLVMLLLASFIEFKLKRSRCLLCGAFGVICIVSSFVFTRTPSVLIERYAYSILNLNYLFPADKRADRSISYTPTEVQFYKRMYGLESRVNLINPKQNIILIIVESLSSADSKRVSGIRDVLPRFDKLSKKGLLFANFFANYEASEGGIRSIISGVPPIPYPGASRYLFNEFSRQDSTIPYLKELGYHTELISTTDIEFLGENLFLKGIGIDRYTGREAFLDKVSNVVKAKFSLPDDVVYREALSRVDYLLEKQHPFVLFLSTGSSHPPYRHPYNPDERSAAGVWDWVIEQIEIFHRELEQRGFFENGLLLITGDHRRMTVIRKSERRRYGESAMARIPLLVLGADIPKGKIDYRFFQQADIFRRLNKILKPNEPLSLHPVWVERYTHNWGDLKNFGHITVFSQATDGMIGYRARFTGSCIDWVGEAPPFAEAVERELHTLRAVAQDAKERSLTKCLFDFGNQPLEASGEHGVRIYVYSGMDLQEKLDPTTPRFIERVNYPNLNFEDLRNGSFVRKIKFSLSATSFIDIEKDGGYWFRIDADDGVCLAFDKTVVYQRNEIGGKRDGEVEVQIKKGLHRIDLLYFQRLGAARLRLFWLSPSEVATVQLRPKWTIVPQKNFFLPERMS